VPSTLPAGEPAPADGALPAAAAAQVGTAPFGLYLHVPFCTVRCGYCDFNTYTATELGPAPGASLATWADAALAELALARQVLGAAAPPVSTLFVGGGTPSLLAATDLARVLRGVADLFGFEPDAEVTTEANPESTTPAWLQQVREAGVTRLSLGMQSARPHVLAVLDRTHDPQRVPAVVAAGRAAGLASISVDLIYGTPGESLGDWHASLDAALATAPDHVSAYALIVEPGTRLAAAVARGDVPLPNDDLMAAMYEMADARFAARGWEWYELSNWASGPTHRSRHNQLYWSDADWWGVGPGAHSHVRGVRWWNVKHPAAWAARLAAGHSPAAAREVPDAEARRLERVMLGLRTREGAALVDVDAAAVAALVDDALVDPAPLASGQVVLTRRGRLLADAVTLRLVSG
jgi:oxygen-independent coproporphyrinogen-3 oxidase